MNVIQYSTVSRMHKLYACLEIHCIFPCKRITCNEKSTHHCNNIADNYEVYELKTKKLPQINSAVATHSLTIGQVSDFWGVLSNFFFINKTNINNYDDIMHFKNIEINIYVFCSRKFAIYQ